jgi:hypothetical protein
MSQLSLDSYYPVTKRLASTTVTSDSSFFTPDYWTHPQDFANSQTSEFLLAHRPTKQIHPDRLKQAALPFMANHTISSSSKPLVDKLVHTTTPSSQTTLGGASQLASTLDSSSASSVLGHNATRSRPLQKADLNIADTAVDSNSQENLDSQNLFFANLDRHKYKKRKHQSKHRRKLSSATLHDTPLSSTLTRGQL